MHLFSITQTQTLLIFFSFCLVQIYCHLSIYSPADLKELFPNPMLDLNFTIANFGYNPYGKKLFGRLYLAKPPRACEPLSQSDFPFNGNENDPRNNPIVLIEGAGCTIITKAINSQFVGAKMVIIIDTTDDDISDVVIPDDPHNVNVTIPTVMISKHAGDKLKNYLLKNSDTPVQISAIFSLKKNNVQPKVDFWYSSGNFASYNFINRFRDYISEFGDAIHFSPHVATWSSETAAANNFSLVEANCISGGRYCSPDPDGSGPANGSSVVIQNLRQVCIAQIAGIWTWISYVWQYGQTCSYDYKDECYKTVLKHIVNIDTSHKVNKCFEDSFTGNNTMIDDNLILKGEKNRFEQANVHYIPTVVVDHKQFKGNLIPPGDVVTFICSMLEGQHDQCVDLDEQDEMEMIVMNEGQWIEIVVICGALLGVVLVVFVFYKSAMKSEMKREMNMQLQQIISDYAVLVEKNRDRSSGMH